IYLQSFSNVLDALGRTGLRDDVTIAPVGGLDKLATFVALLGANELELVVLHDFAGQADQRLETLVREKLLQQQQVLNYAQFRAVASASRSGTKAAAAPSLPATDVEDLLPPDLYLDLFNTAYKKELGGKVIALSDLPKGERIVARIEQYLQVNGPQVRPSGGFNHYRVANHLAAN